MSHAALILIVSYVTLAATPHHVPTVIGPAGSRGMCIWLQTLSVDTEAYDVVVVSLMHVCNLLDELLQCV